MHKTVNDIIAKKGSKKISVVTSYDYTMATLCDQVDILLVGDSAGMVMLGYENTAPVTMDEMVLFTNCLLYTSPSPRDRQKSRMPSSA